MPLFAELEPSARRRAPLRPRAEVRAGETVIQRWQGARDFYVIVAGRSRS